MHHTSVNVTQLKQNVLNYVKIRVYWDNLQNCLNQRREKTIEEKMANVIVPQKFIRSLKSKTIYQLVVNSYRVFNIISLLRTLKQ